MRTPSNQPQTDQAFSLATLAAQLADSKKAEDILILDTSEVSELADFFVICSAASQTQIRAISETIRASFKEKSFMPVSEDRHPASTWHLLDYGDVIIHIMHPEERSFYGLEEFWSHAEKVPPHQWQEKQAS